MNTTIKRRIAGLERTWPRPRSLADLQQDAGNIVRLTGTTYESAFKGLLVDLSYEDVKRIAAEAESLKSRNHTVVRDAANGKARDYAAPTQFGGRK